MISFIGGKSKIGKWLITKYPIDMEIYVEVFGGMMWCYFNMDLKIYPNLKKIVYNDLNVLNYNLFKCIQNPTQLLKYLEKIPYQKLNDFSNNPIYKEQFISFQNEIYDKNLLITSPNYDIASKYVYVLTQVFSGTAPEKATFIDLKGNYKSKYEVFIDKLKNEKWVNKFISITDIENMDFSDVIKKYDGDKTFFYTDPPYFSKEKYYSNHNFNLKSHYELYQSLKNIKGGFGLSYYDFDELGIWYNENDYKWYKKDFTKAASAKKGTKQNKSTEIYITN